MNTKRPRDTSMNFMWNTTLVALVIDTYQLISLSKDPMIDLNVATVHTHISSDMGVLINARRGHTQSITHIPIKSGKEVDK